MVERLVTIKDYQDDDTVSFRVEQTKHDSDPVVTIQVATDTAVATARVVASDLIRAVRAATE